MGTAQKKQTTPPPAVNEPLAFINFVAAFAVGNTVEGEVVSFTSHGAMVDVSLPGGGVLHCYIPLTAMGTPPPTKARQVLKKGEVRPFVLAGLDPPRRVAELALPVPTHEKKVPGEKARRPQEGRFGGEEGAGEEGGSHAGQESAAKKAAAAGQEGHRPRRRRHRRRRPRPRRRPRRARHRPRRPARAGKAPAKKAAKAPPR